MRGDIYDIIWQVEGEGVIPDQTHIAIKFLGRLEFSGIQVVLQAKRKQMLVQTATQVRDNDERIAT